MDELSARAMGMNVNPPPDRGDGDGEFHGFYDEDEAYDAADHGEVEVPEGTADLLLAHQLMVLYNAGFPPGDES